MVKTDKVQIGAFLSPMENDIFNSLSNYYEMTKTELLKRWIYAEAISILTPEVDEAIRLGIAESDNRNPKIAQIRKLEIQQYMETVGKGRLVVSMLPAIGLEEVTSR